MRWLSLPAALCLLLLPFVGLLSGQLWPGSLVEAAEAKLSALRDAGPAVLAAVLALQVLVVASGILPASLVGLAAGAMYGIGLGFSMAVSCTLAGAALTFWLSRSLFRPMIARLLPERPRLRNLDILLAREGWKLVCLLRISPLMPFAATSYALGLSSVKLRAYLAGTLLSLPSLLGYVVIGHSAGALGSSWHDGPDPTRLALLGVGGVVTVLATLRIGQIARRAIDSVTP